MHISTSVTSDRPRKLLGLYLWMKLINPKFTIALVYILRQLRKAIHAAEKENKKNNFYERFIKQEEEYDLIIDAQMRKEMQEMELKKAKDKDKKEDDLLLMIHTIFENACKKIGVIYVDPVLIYENFNARELKSSVGFSPDNVEKMPEFKVVQEFFSEVQKAFVEKIEELNGKEWQDKMQPAINQLKENMHQIMVGTFLRSITEANLKPTPDANNDALFINGQTQKNITHTLQYLEAEYQKKQASQANMGLENPVKKIGKMLEGHYTPKRLEEIEKKAIKEKIVPEEVLAPKNAKESIQALEEKIKTHSAPKPKRPY